MFIRNVFMLIFSLYLATGYSENKPAHLTYNRACFKPNWCQIADASFQANSLEERYTLMTFAYPIFTPLSLFRNGGLVQGNFQLTPSGMIVGQPGNYYVNMSTVITNNEFEEDYTPLITAFIARNGIYDPSTTNSIGGVAVVPFEQVITIQASGVLLNVEPGTELSIVVANGGSPQPEPITVLTWRISVFKIPCDSL